jgi:ARC6-like, IMS domain
MNFRRMLLIGVIPCLFLQGCETGKKTNSNSQVGCANSSNMKLANEDVKEVVLTTKSQKMSGVATNNQLKGYKFVGKKDQKISYYTEPNGFCVWLYNSENQVIKDTIIPKDGTYIIQVGAAEKSGTFDISLSMGVDPPSPPASVSSSVSSSPSSESPNSSGLSKEDAKSIISKWLEAKKSIFGSSYDKQAGKEITTGLAYERNIQAPPGQEESSVDDLRKNGLYYTYEYQEIHDILSINSTSPDSAAVKILVSENRTRHRSGGGSRQESTTRKSSCYLLQKDSGSWKIAKDPTLLTCN